MLETGRCGRHHPFSPRLKQFPVLARVTPKLHPRCMLRLAKTATFVPQCSVPVRKRVTATLRYSYRRVFRSRHCGVAVARPHQAPRGPQVRTARDVRREYARPVMLSHVRRPPFRCVCTLRAGYNSEAYICTYVERVTYAQSPRAVNMCGAKGPFSQTCCCV